MDRTGYAAMFLALVALPFVLAACGDGTAAQGADEKPTAGASGPATKAPSAVPEVFFAERRSGGEDMMAEIRGELILDGGGCLRVRSGSGSHAVVWPAGFGLDEEDGGGARVLDSGGRVAARVGEAVHMGGGESPISGNGAADERTGRRLQERCPGPYWIAAPSVRIPEP